MAKINILITGADGYLGWHLSSKLSQNNDYRIIGFVRSKKKLKRKNINKRLLIDSMEELNQFEINVVIHCATNYGRDKNFSLLKIVESNVIFPLNIIETLSKNQKKVFDFINLDTVLEKNNNSYSLSKWQFKELALVAQKKKSFKLTTLRLEHFYGIDAPDNNFITYLIKKMSSGESYIKLTKGDQYRDFIYIDDLIDAIKLVLEKLLDGDSLKEEIDIGTGKVIQIKNLAQFIKAELKSSTLLNFGAIPYRDNELMHSNSNIDYIKKLGWSSKTSIKDGILILIKSL